MQRGAPSRRHGDRTDTRHHDRSPGRPQRGACCVEVGCRPRATRGDRPGSSPDARASGSRSTCTGPGRPSTVRAKSVGQPSVPGPAAHGSLGDPGEERQMVEPLVGDPGGVVARDAIRQEHHRLAVEPGLGDRVDRARGTGPSRGHAGAGPPGELTGDPRHDAGGRLGVGEHEAAARPLPRRRSRRGWIRRRGRRTRSRSPARARAHQRGVAPACLAAWGRRPWSRRRGPQVEAVGVAGGVEVVDGQLEGLTIAVEVDAVDPQDGLARRAVDVRRQLRWCPGGGDALVGPGDRSASQTLDDAQDGDRPPLSTDRSG